MIKWLNKIRKPETDIKISRKFLGSLLVLLFGIGLGFFSKWLERPYTDTSFWINKIFESLKLSDIFTAMPIWLLLALVIAIYSKTPIKAGINVFLFFLGMCTSYHYYTINYCGFNPRSYMMVWYGITILSPLLAFICLYSKGKSIPSIIIDILILTVLFLTCFSTGIWYFGFLNISSTIVFIISVIILYTSPKNTAIILLGTVITSYIFNIIFYL